MMAKPFMPRPTPPPFAAKFILLFFMVLSAVLAVSTGYYHQRWQNQVKRSVRLQRQLEMYTKTGSSTLNIDPAGTAK